MAKFERKKIDPKNRMHLGDPEFEREVERAFRVLNSDEAKRKSRVLLLGDSEDEVSEDTQELLDEAYKALGCAELVQ